MTTTRQARAVVLGIERVEDRPGLVRVSITEGNTQWSACVAVGNAAATIIEQLYAEDTLGRAVLEVVDHG